MSVDLFLGEMQSAFSAFDLERVVGLYSAPLAIIHERTTILVDTPQQLRERAIQSLKAMQNAGIVQFDLSLVSQTAVGENLTMVRYESVRRYSNGTSDLPAYEAIVVREIRGQLGITASINPRSRWRDTAGLPQVSS